MPPGTPAPRSRPRSGEIHMDEDITVRVAVLEAVVGQLKLDAAQKHADVMNALSEIRRAQLDQLGMLHEKINRVSDSTARIEATCGQCRTIDAKLAGHVSALDRKPMTQDTTVKIRRSDPTMSQFFGGAALSALKIVAISTILAGILAAVGFAYFKASTLNPKDNSVLKP